MNRWLMIKQLDIQLKEWLSVSSKYKMPPIGWVRLIRMALNMTVQQLANRMGLSHSRIVQLEQAEENQAITLRTLIEAADALECDFVYAFVPKNNRSLEQIIEERAKKVAEEQIKNVFHTMILEDQAIETQVLNFQKEELTRILKERLNSNLWKESKDAELLNKLKILLKKK